jgi:hypothetical protein
MAKRRAESQIGNLTLNHKKSRITLTSLRPGSLPHTVRKLSTRSTTLLETSPQLEVCTKKLWASKIVKVPILGILGLPLANPKTKWHFSAGPVAKHRIYYKGKVVASPNSKSWWVLWVCVCSWLVYAPKVFQLCTNQLVVWFVQVRVSNWFARHSS